MQRKREDVGHSKTVLGSSSFTGIEFILLNYSRALIFLPSNGHTRDMTRPMQLATDSEWIKLSQICGIIDKVDETIAIKSLNYQVWKPRAL
jgi:hypothetical protein